MRTANARPSTGLLALALFAALFGAATLVSGGRVLFGPPAVRAAAGAVVPFVLGFNFLAGFAYVAAAAGIALGRRWALALTLGIAAATGVAALAFVAHALMGGAFEARTAAAMALRFSVWTGIAAILRRADRGAHGGAGGSSSG